jgi:divalent metal cation (Fe/Co/Zn/Cd) transporter
MSTGGSKLRWYLDPMGAIIIGLGIIIAWTRSIYRQFEFLAGKSAPHEFIQLLIYKSMTFSDDIVQLDTVRAYHSGPDYFVEIDIVMDGSTPLYKAHDISQQLQDKIEELPTVERAFVHVDYETTHSPVCTDLYKESDLSDGLPIGTSKTDIIDEALGCLDVSRTI